MPPSQTSDRRRRPAALRRCPRVRRRAEAAATRTRGRSAGEARCRRPAAARADGHERLGEDAPDVRERALGVILDLVQPAREPPRDGDEHRQDREDRKRIGVQPRRKQRPASGGDALDVGMQQVDGRRGGERREPDPEREPRPQAGTGRAWRWPSAARSRSTASAAARARVARASSAARPSAAAIFTPTSRNG